MTCLTTKNFLDLAETDETWGLGTMKNSAGTIQWNPHNLVVNSDVPITQSITVVSGADYTVECTGSGSVALTGAGIGTVTLDNPVEITASTTTLTLTITGDVDLMWAYRSDLGGMATVPTSDRAVLTLTTYVENTTAAARYLPRRENHEYINGSWVKGMLVEPDGATNYLLNSNTLATQNVTTSAVSYCISFTGTGTVTLSGTSTAGPLVGTGTGEENRVYIAFTPTAGTLTLTVSGTVTNAQLEQGLVPTSYIPTSGSAVSRGAETTTIPASVMDSLGLLNTVAVDGTDLWGTADTLGTGWTDNGDDTYTSDGTQVGDSDAQDTSATVTSGSVYEVTYVVSGYSAGNVTTTLGGNEGTDRSANGTYTDVITAGATTAAAIRADASFVGTVEITRLQEIHRRAIGFQMHGYMSYGDSGSYSEAILLRQYGDSSNALFIYLDTFGSATGAPIVSTRSGGVIDYAVGAGDAYSPGAMVPFKIASRHLDNALQGAVDGVATTENTTPVGLPDLTGVDLGVAYSGPALHITEFNIFAENQPAGDGNFKMDETFVEGASV